jgi:hypothetical protein
VENLEKKMKGAKEKNQIGFEILHRRSKNGKTEKNQTVI